ncbi:MAG: aspartate 1-decarboxylase [Bdellovibrionales bacterium]|nr:aspartate 1-decarboxylase [Bdellovibrionales bacterium]
MNLTMLKSKIHRATVTGADLSYEGSISIDPALMDAAHLREFEKVDIYNCNNGARFSTYVIVGKSGEICLNGAAARCVHRGDLVIIACFANFSEEEVQNHKPHLVFVDETNAIKSINSSYDK